VPSFPIHANPATVGAHLTETLFGSPLTTTSKWPRPQGSTGYDLVLGFPVVRVLLLTIHILAAATWIGGGLFASLSFAQLSRTNSMTRIAELEKALGGKFFGTSVLLLILSGVGLVSTSDAFGWGSAFVLIGIGVVLVDGALEGAIFGPRLKRAAETGDADGQQYRRVLTFSSVSHLALVVFAVWAMVAKFGA
jgi:uncharacterized membrane protein